MQVIFWYACTKDARNQIRDISQSNEGFDIHWKPLLKGILGLYRDWMNELPERGEMSGSVYGH